MCVCFLFVLYGFPSSGRQTKILRPQWDEGNSAVPPKFPTFVGLSFLNAENVGKAEGSKVKG